MSAEDEATIWRISSEEQQARAERAERIVSALLVKFGENVGGSSGPRYRVALTRSELEELPGRLSVNFDPVSGALLIRFRPE